MKTSNCLLCDQSEGTTSHSTKSPKNGDQVAGYAALRVGSDQPEGKSSPQLRCRSFLAYRLSMWLRRNLKVSLRRNSLCSFSRRSLRGALHIGMLATTFRGFQ